MFSSWGCDLPKNLKDLDFTAFILLMAGVCVLFFCNAKVNHTLFDPYQPPWLSEWMVVISLRTRFVDLWLYSFSFLIWIMNLWQRFRNIAYPNVCLHFAFKVEDPWTSYSESVRFIFTYLDMELCFFLSTELAEVKYYMTVYWLGYPPFMFSKNPCCTVGSAKLSHHGIR